MVSGAVAPEQRVRGAVQRFAPPSSSGAPATISGSLPAPRPVGGPRCRRSSSTGASDRQQADAACAARLEVLEHGPACWRQCRCPTHRRPGAREVAVERDDGDAGGVERVDARVVRDRARLGSRSSRPSRATSSRSRSGGEQAVRGRGARTPRGSRPPPPAGRSRRRSAPRGRPCRRSAAAPARSSPVRPERRPARHPARAVAELLRCGRDALAGRRVDAALAVERVRDRRGGHAGGGRRCRGSWTWPLLC